MMINGNIEAIIFDFGGVLININYEDTIQAFKDLGIDDFESMYSKAQQSNLFNDIETGAISPQIFVNRLKEYLPSEVSPNKIIEAWNAMIKEVPKSSIEILQSLKKTGKKIFLLSNTNAIHIDKAYREWDKVSSLAPEEIFHHVYLSHEIHLRKPNAEIFEFVCEQEGLNPLTTLFIDDSIQHIEGASIVGLQTYHLESMTNLQSIIS